MGMGRGGGKYSGGGHIGPDKMGRNEAVCGLESRVAKGMHEVKNLFLE